MKLIVTVVPYVLRVLCWLATLVSACVSAQRIRALRKLLFPKSEKERRLKALKYQTAEKRKRVSQEFSEYAKDYVLNPATNQLEELEIPKNIQAKIDSYVECALDRALEKFLPRVVGESEDVLDYPTASADLAALGEAMETAEYYREHLGLPDNYSMAQIYEAVDERAKSLKAKLGEVSKKKEDVKNHEEEQS